MLTVTVFYKQNVTSQSFETFTCLHGTFTGRNNDLYKINVSDKYAVFIPASSILKVEVRDDSPCVL